MKYLAIDSTASNIGIILSIDGKTFVKNSSNDRKASEILLTIIDELLDKAKVTLSDLDFFAVVTGPGSFTGIRIGVNTVKTFAYALKKQVVAVNAFEKIAYNKIGKKPTVCVIKAYADYCFVCALGENGALLGSPECVTYEQAKTMIKDGGYSVIADEESVSEIAKAKKDDWKNSLIKAVESKAERNEYLPFTQVEPYYMLVSQAEKELEKKNK